MCQIPLDIPEAVLYDIKMSKMEATAEIRKIVALQYYVKHGVSLGYCAAIAGMDKEEFLEEMQNA